MKYNIIQEPVNCFTAEQFLDSLSPIGKYFSEQDFYTPWLFRGQGLDKNWPLIPSLFRTDKIGLKRLSELSGKKVKDNISYPQLREIERSILSDFFWLSDKRGLTLPDDSQRLRIFLEMMQNEKYYDTGSFGGNSIESEGMSLTALAQHYGVPTRLLDWTRQAYIAAFFAGESAFRQTKNNDHVNHLVVWAFYFPEFGKQLNYGDEYLLRVITAPSASNPNLKAQQGVFTLVNPFYSKEKEGGYLALDAMLNGLAEKADPERSDISRLVVKCKLRKFTLPHSQSKNLLRLLARLDITPSTIYPGYHSIVSDMQMRNL